jgi:iron complex transport system substrate-binding protein
MLMRSYPSRIVCLTEETTETLYLIEEDWRIVGICGYTLRPRRARLEKPRVSAFTSARINKILALRPDLVLGFSDLQADIAANLIRHGLAVHIFNQRSCAGILQMIRCLGGLVGAVEKADRLAKQLAADCGRIAAAAAHMTRRPRVYFEEWDEPCISAIEWVSELIELAGGINVFADLASRPLGRDRIIVDPCRIIEAAPDIIIASWCGKKVNRAAIMARPGFRDIPAVRDGEIHEIKSTIILQPGPVALTEGAAALAAIIGTWCQRGGATSAP